MPQPLAELLLRRGCTVAVAESLTAGMVVAQLAEVPGISAVLRGGVVAYATDVKHHLLGVEAQVLAEHTPVSEPVAGAMAAGVRKVLSADLGIATTGVAGPDPQEGRPVGLVYIAVATSTSVHVREFTFTGTRADIRGAATRAALAFAADALLTEGPD